MIIACDNSCNREKRLDKGKALDGSYHKDVFFTPVNEMLGSCSKSSHTSIRN